MLNVVDSDGREKKPLNEWTLDKTINLPTIVTVGMLFTAVIAFGLRLEGRIELSEQNIQRVDSSVNTLVIDRLTSATTMADVRARLLMVEKRLESLERQEK